MNSSILTLEIWTMIVGSLLLKKATFSYLRTFIRIHWYRTQFPPPSSLLYGKMGSITLFFFKHGNIRYDTTFYAWDIGRQFTLFHFLLQWEWASLWDLKGRELSWAVKGKNKKHKIPFWRVESYLFGKVYLEGKKVLNHFASILFSILCMSIWVGMYCWHGFRY